MEPWKHTEEQAKHVIEWVRAAESREGTLTKAAKALGVAQSYLSYVLSRKKTAGQKLERALAAYFGITLEQLLTTDPGGRHERRVPVAVLMAPEAGPGPTADALQMARSVQMALCDDLGCESDIASSAVGRVLFSGGEPLTTEYAIYRAAARLIVTRGDKLLG